MPVPTRERNIVRSVRNARAIAAAVAVVAIAAPAVASARPPAGTKKATTFRGTPTVGALFDSTTSRTHFCTASVVSSPHGNVLITAAHCVQGSAAGWSFAPGFRRGVSPYGRWKVTGAYLDKRWIAEQDPRRDYAFLTTAPKRINGARTEVQTLTGSNELGVAPRRGETVTVPAYPRGKANLPVTCTAKVYLHGIFPAFNCNPYVDGTSGSPWLATTPDGRFVVGLIAGLHQGGCFPYTSYSPPLGSQARAVYRRAVAGAKPDIAPKPGSDGCSTGL
jgi:V8-like Glu-specific endopeptidase